MTVRRALSTGLLALAGLLSFVLGPLLYVSNVIDDEDRFVVVADRVLQHEDVRRAVASEVTTLTFEAIEADEALASILPGQARSFSVPLTKLVATQLTDAGFVILDTEIVRGTTDTALREVHRQFSTSSSDEELVIDLRAVLVRSAREVAGPAAGAGAAKLVNDSQVGRYTLAEQGTPAGEVVAAIRAVPAMGRSMMALTAVVLLGAIAASLDRRRALVIGGFCLSAGAAGSTIVFATLALGGASLAGSKSELAGAVAGVVASDFAEQQRQWMLGGLMLAGLGMLFGNRPASVALRRLPRQLLERDQEGAVECVANVVDDNPALTRLVTWLGAAMILVGWQSPTWRVVITVLLLTVVAQLAIWLFSSQVSTAKAVRARWSIAEPPMAPEGTDTWRLRVNLALVVMTVFLFWPGWGESVVLTFFGGFALLQALADVRAARRYSALAAAAEADPVSLWERRRVLIFAAGLLLLLGAVTLTIGSDEPAVADGGCNGHIELCDRRIDEVVFAGSHNSMSSTELGWDLAMQTGDIIAQLDHGVRALLIDALYWGESGSVEGGEDLAASAMVESALADDEPRPGTWLCHGFCALGATNFEAALTDIDLWLLSHPGEVVLIVLQDEITSEDTIAAFENSGLRERVHQHVPGEPFPTLGELVALDQRVLVYAENAGESDSWFQNAWEDAFTETPFTFEVRSDFSCESNRGDADNPLFLVNHWVTTGIPVREAAAAINTTAALRARVEACEEERGRLPSVLAVDFVQTGDLIDYVNELNGVN